jgi:hypothetical protein
MSRRSLTKPARCSWARVAAVLAIVAGTACGGQSDSSSDECGHAAPGLQAPDCTCTSWTNHVVPTSDYAAGGPPVLVPDWSAFPPQASVKIGQRFSVSHAVIQRRPFDCNQGYASGSIVWSSSDPAVLALEGTPAGGLADAVFLAVAPGTARVSAGNLAAPGGGVAQAELTTCNRGATGSLQDGFICADRVPLPIRVVP